MPNLTVVSFDGHNINDGSDYLAGFVGQKRGLPAVSVQSAARTGRWPVVSGVQRPGRKLTLNIIIMDDANVQDLQDQLSQWFDPEDETPKRLVAQRDALQLYVMAVCEALEETADSGGTEFRATLVVHDEVRWRAVTEAGVDWDVTSDGDTQVVSNAGTDRAFPVLEITPRSGKTNDYLYKRWVPIRWRLDEGYNRYPVDIADGQLDGAALVSAGKLRISGIDLRAIVNGREAASMVVDPNTAATKLWVHLNFRARQEVTLRDAIASTGAVDTIDVEEDIRRFPAAGIVMIDDEAFTYGRKNNQLRRFLDVERAERGTSMAAHSAGDTVWWVQHDIWMVYGNAVVAEFPPLAEVAFDETTSTNTVWEYWRFGGTSLFSPPGSWQRQEIFALAEFYGSDRAGSFGDLQVAEEAAGYELGIRCIQNALVGAPRGRIWLHNPCGIVSANFTNGEKRNEAPALSLMSAWIGKIQSSGDGVVWFDEYSIAAPSLASTWESWSRNETLAAEKTFVALYHELDRGTQFYAPNFYTFLEADDCVVTLDSDNTPVVTVGAEQGNYQLDCRITNEATGEAIDLFFNMAIDETLTVDTAQKLVSYSLDGRQYFEALTVAGGPRRDWLALEPGNNTLRFDEVGVTDVDVRVEWEARYYG